MVCLGSSVFPLSLVVMMIPVMMIPVMILRATHPLHHEGVHTAPSTIVGPMLVATTTFGDVTMVWQHLGMDNDPRGLGIFVS